MLEDFNIFIHSNHNPRELKRAVLSLVYIIQRFQFLFEFVMHHQIFNFPKLFTVRHIYQLLDVDEVTGKIKDEWYIVVPQIRVCR